jgi:hypothetical protein
MVLKDWTDILNLLKACRRRLVHGFSGRQAAWLVAFCLPPAVLAVLYFRTGPASWAYSVASVVLVPLTLIFSWRWMVAVDKAAAKKFAGEYQTHGLAEYSLWKRREYLLYALFLQGLAQQGRSRDDIARLKRFAEALAPAPTSRVTQFAIVVILLAVLTNLLAEWVKRGIPEEAWKSWSMWKVFLPIIELIYLASVGGYLFAGVKNWRETRRQEILRFLQWAEEDIPEEKSPKDIN